MANGRGFLTGILLVSFILLALSAWNFISSKSDSLEQFIDDGAPTRAADCQCLPGYIPSTKTGSKYGGRFIWNNGGVHYVKDGTSVRNWVSNCTMCGINICDWNVMNKVTAEEYRQLTPGPNFNCEILKAAQTTSSSFYFCQSLTNPNETRKCY
jgi:hypothetical protein